ncbi:MAG: branched-chain amino acid ABC transporter permease, partial [Bacilli bacterium]
MRSFSVSNLWLFLVGVVFLAFPFINDSRSMLILLTQVFIFAVFAMSYDLLLGYTGIVSFGHAMFFGIGAYTTAIFMHRMDQTIAALLLSLVVGAILAGIVSFFVG